MKVGLTPQHFFNIASVDYVFVITAQVLAERHELIYFPAEYDYSAPERQEELAREWLEKVDVVVGPAHLSILKARSAMAIKPRYLCILFGTMSRGAQNLSAARRYLLSSDILIGNCAADLALVGLFFENAHAELLPFPCNDAIFYPLDREERPAIRSRMGFAPDDKILLYVGRITLEKNVHTLLRTFRIVEQLDPSAHLIVVGAEFDVQFQEFGVFPISIANMLRRAIGALGLTRVRFVGPRPAAELREMYNAADFLVNMTLHHDENFGFAQVEAMACGTPVVATRWGGLRDTVIDGETGASVATVVTGLGVKVDWWDAANKIMRLLRDPREVRRLGEECRKRVSAHYSIDEYRRRLGAIVAGCGAETGQREEPLRARDFGEKFWRNNSLQPGEKPPYRRTEENFGMYKTLIGLFAGRVQEETDSRKTLSPGQVLCMAVPLIVGDGLVSVNDPIFPFEVRIPADIYDAVVRATEVMSRRPAITMKDFQALCMDVPDIAEALTWMIGNGMVLLSEAPEGPIGTECIPAQMAVPLFSIHRVSCDETDIVFLT